MCPVTIEQCVNHPPNNLWYSAPESQKVVKSFPTILDYARRIHDRYFPDYEFPK